MGKYDIISGMSEYKSTFTDPGIQNFKEVAKIYRETYDKNEEATNLMLKTVNQMDLTEGDDAAGLRDVIRNNITNQLGSVIEQGNYEDASLAVNNSYRYLTSDMTVIQAQKNAAERKKDKEYIQQFGMDGVVDFNDGLGATFQTVNPDGSLNKYESQMEIMKDYAGRMQSLLGNIAGDGGSLGPEYGDLNADQINDYIRYGKVSGVSQKKLDRVVNKLYETYLGTAEGAQDYRRLTQTGARLQPVDAKADILRRFSAVGAPQVGRDATYNYQFGDGVFSAGPDTGGSDVGSTYSLAEMVMSGAGSLPPAAYAAATGTNYDPKTNSVPVTYGDNTPIMLTAGQNYSESEINKLNQIYSNLGIGAEGMDTKDLTESIMMATGAGMEAKDAIAFIHRESGVKIPEAQYNSIVTTVKDNVLNEKLRTMGTGFISGFSGSFTPYTNQRVVRTGVGTVVQPGRYRVTKDELNRMAGKMGLGFIGLDLRPGVRDIDNIKDAQGNKIFTKVETDDGTFYEFDGYSAPVNMMDETVFGNVTKYDMGQAMYDKNKPQLRTRLDNSQQFQATVADFSLKAMDSLSGSTNKALTSAMTLNSKMALIYREKPDKFLAEAKAAEQAGTLSQFINDPRFR
jgi:hypothetical protein